MKTLEQFIREIEELEGDLRKLKEQMVLLMKDMKQTSNISQCKKVIPCDINTIIVNNLHGLGIPSNLSGYKYLKTAIKLLVEGKVANDFYVTKELYPEVAKLHNKTQSQVERAIRHAIEVGYGRGDLKLWKAIFGNSISYQKDKPTNWEFISTLVEYMVA